MEDAPLDDRRGGEATAIGSEGPVFEAPWQARAFAIAVALADEHYAWSDFNRRFTDEKEIPGSSNVSEAAYYERWLRALQQLLEEEGLVGPDELAARAAEFEAGDRTAHEFVEGQHGDTDHAHGGDHHH